MTSHQSDRLAASEPSPVRSDGRTQQQIDQALIDLIPDQLIWVDRTGTILRARAAVGQDPAEVEGIVGLSVDVWLPAERAEMTRYLLAQTIDRGEVTTVEMLLPIEGVAKIYELRLSPSGDNEVVVLVRDITARRADEVLVQQQSHIIDQIQDAIVVTDLEGRIRRWNAGATRIFGYGAEEMQGRNAIRLLLAPHVGTGLDRGKILAALRATGAHELTVLLKRKGGEQIYAHVALSLLRDEAGQPSEVLGYLLDRTQERKAELLLERKLDCEGVVSAISTRFVGRYDLNEAITASLADMGRVAGASRCYLFQFRNDGTRVDNTHEWTAPNVEPEIDFLQDLPTTTFPYFISRLRAGKEIHVPDVKALPEEASAERISLTAQSITSCILVPMVVGREVAGFLGYDRTDDRGGWDDESLTMLRVGAGIMGNALERRRAEEAEKTALRLSQVLNEALTTVTQELDLSDMLDQILAYLEKVIPYDSAALLLMDDDEVQVIAARGFPDPERVIGRRFTTQNPLFEEMMRSETPLVLEDASSDPRFFALGGTQYVRGWIGVPLRAQGRHKGFLTVDSRQVGTFSETEAMLAQAFANEAVLAIENALLFEKVQRLAITDDLTGLYNRRHFLELAEAEFERSLRYGDPITMLMLDLDHFKEVNDRWGHDAGDLVLAEVASTCEQAVRLPDQLGRYGGEEFILMLPETDAQAAGHIAERIRSLISELQFEVDDEAFSITASLGVATLKPDCASLRELLKRTDLALYAAKAQGRNCVVTWDEVGDR